MTSLDTQKAIVIVFGMHECPACEHYIPRLAESVERLRGQGFPFVLAQGPEPISPEAIPVLVYDAASPDVDVQKLADRFEVHATPTTIVACRGPGSFKIEGSLADNQIEWVLMMANEAAQR